MTSLSEYLDKRGIGEDQMERARRHTRAAIDAYALREARASCGMTQVEVARSMGVSQNRVSRMENGDLAAMGVDAVRRYVEALGGRLSMVAELPGGRVVLL